MLDKIDAVGSNTLNKLQDIGASGVFLFKLFFTRPKARQFLVSLRDQIYYIGFLSCLIIVVSGLFIGMVVGLQGYNTLEKFGASSALGQLIALSVVRELGPVITALLFAGRAGSALAAEIGLMRATEQIDSMSMMGVNPLVYVVYPRFIAGVIAMPILSLIFAAIAVFGGYLVGVEWLGVDSGSFWSNMQSVVDFKLDVLSGIIKSIVFAFLVVWIAVFQGYTCKASAAGISQATTRTVVYASLAILGFDFLLTAVMIGGW